MHCQNSLRSWLNDVFVIFPVNSIPSAFQIFKNEHKKMVLGVQLNECFPPLLSKVSSSPYSNTD